MFVSELWRQGGAGKVEVVEAWWGKSGWMAEQAGGADVIRAEDELQAETQSHRRLRYSLEREGRQKQ